MQITVGIECTDIAGMPGHQVDGNAPAGAGTVELAVRPNGDELFGNFSVQLVPRADPGLFDLVGQVDFSGGTGSFLDARGSASLLGSGQFISQTLALTHFVFEGQVSAVPEPSSLALFAGGLAGCFACLRPRRGRPVAVRALGWR